MRALRVQINDQAPVTAGAKDLGVLTAVITCVGKLGPDAVSPRGDQTESLKVDLGGLTSRSSNQTNENLDWLQSVPVQVGDKITIEVLEATCVDPIDHAEQAKRRQTDTREYYEHCKETYFKLRDQYESEA